MRVLLFTGKGGVGKTTTAAATALHCAERGARTIVLSTDPAHSLSDAFDIDLASTPTPVVEGLWGQQLDAQERMEEAWSDIQTYLLEVFEWAGVEGIEAEELSVFPGLDEVFSLSDIKTYADSGEWDVIVVDCAPTAETIRFLSLPDILSWYMTRVFPASRRLNKVFGSARRFYDRLDGVRELLTDTARTSVRLVVNPERMVIAEARRTATYLALFGYGVDAVIANRLLPETITDPWFQQWKELQTQHLTTIEEGFAPLPILRAELAPDELVGLDRLRSFATDLYRDLDATEVLHPGSPLEVRKRGDTAELIIDLPFADRDDLELGRRHDELLVRVGAYRRSLLLPDSLRKRTVTAASLRDGRLRVTFASHTTPSVETDRRSASGARGSTR